MARKSLKERFNRKIIEVGQSSLCITLPVEYLEELGWKKGEEVRIKMRKRRKQLILERIGTSSFFKWGVPLVGFEKVAKNPPPPSVFWELKLNTYLNKYLIF